ncbi:MAG TPA: GRP family sugar transporter [Acidobacteriaceae bacterium]|nr:GRP family sugar transporter [Acidobacteriaceae bacterium]
MFVPHSFAVALVMMVMSTLCWGSWANTYKLIPNYRFELAYWDYSIGVVLTSLVFAFTLGSAGGKYSFAHNLHTAAGSNLAYAFIGGFIFNIANLLLVAGVAITGLAVAFPLSIGIALVEGVALSYAIQPKGDPALLSLGVCAAVLAVILVGKAYGNLPRQDTSTSRRGVVLCIVSGFLMGAFAPFNARALTSSHPLTPYSINVLFSMGAFAACMVFNPYLMKRPLTGSPVAFAGYLKATPWQHAMGLASGAIWGVGMIFNLVAASLVGMSISYAIGQASPMVAAIWGVFVFHEFRHAGKRAKIYLAGMFLCYLLALMMISQARPAS